MLRYIGDFIHKKSLKFRKWGLSTVYSNFKYSRLNGKKRKKRNN